MKRTILFLLLVMALLIACAPAPQTSGSPATSVTKSPSTVPVDNSLPILADYQVKSAFEEVINKCAGKTNVRVSVDYVSSTTLRATHLNNAKEKYAGYWATSINFLPANSALLTFTAKTYIVAGAQASQAKNFGWNGNFVKVKAVLDLIPSGKIKLGMTNPTQSDPSASFLAATSAVFSGETTLTGAGITRLPDGLFKSYFGNLENVTDNADTLKTEIIDDLKNKRGKYNAYILYESHLVQINQELVRLGIEPISAFYLSDATVGATFPLSYVQADARRDAFARFSSCVASDAESKKILESRGYRTPESGYSMEVADPKVFNKSWGVDATMADLPLKNYPRPEVMTSLLNLYQSNFRKPRVLVSINDHSGSMDYALPNGSTGKKLLDKGIDLYFNQDTNGQGAAQGLHIGPQDIYSVFVYSDACTYLGSVAGSTPKDVTAMGVRVQKTKVGGGTATYDCVRDAINQTVSGKYQMVDESGKVTVKEISFQPEKYAYGIYVMTDGVRTSGWVYDNFIAYYNKLPANHQIKIYGVGLGRDLDMSEGKEFDRFIKLGRGVLKDGNANLVESLKSLFNNY